MSNYTVNQLHQAAWLVYINGLEIPVMGVDTNWGVWQMPTATVHLVPHPMLQRIGYEDKLQVVIFYLDEFWYADNPQFCLLGEFEVVGFTYSNSSHGRSIQLDCVSQDQILQQLRFYYLSSLSDVAGASVGSNAASGAFQTTKVMYPMSLFTEGLTSDINLPEETVEGENAAAGFIKRPIDFVTNIFRAILSPVKEQTSYDATTAAYTDEEGTIPVSTATAPNKNYFARWMKMTGYHKRWAAFPLLEDKKDDTCFPLLKALQDTQTLGASQSAIGESVGEAGTAWQLLQKVFGAMYMEIAMMPSPPAVITDKVTGIVQDGKSVPGPGQSRTILSHYAKPQCLFSLPPTCNVIFPSQVINSTYRESYITQPTRLYLREDYISRVVNTAKDGDMSQISADMLGTGYPKAVRKRLADLTIEATKKDFLLFPEEMYKGPVTSQLNGPPLMYMLWQQRKGTQDPEELSDTEVLENNNIFDAYAEYEYYRSRYAERQGGASLAWQPYLVPGFPTAVFDQENGGIHNVAYLSNVSHSMSATKDGASLSTSVSFSYMRTMLEFMGLLGDPESFDTSLDIAPVEIIPLISETFQNTDNAQTVYQKLFYKGQKLNRPAVFDWKRMLHLVNAYNATIDLAYSDLKEKALRGANEDALVVPNTEFKPLFENYDAAMQYVSRPVCTLTEYIEAYHGKPVSNLKAEGTLKGEYASFYSVTKDKNRSKGAVFWGRIYKLVQGPGTDPGVSVTNMGPAPDYAAAGPEGLKFVDKSTGMPETRRDWDKTLEAYRKIIRSETGNLAPMD